MSRSGWIGVDLDGTLALYGYTPHDVIGEPIPLMLERVKKWLESGVEVRIFTARVGPHVEAADLMKEREAIEAWCVKHLGTPLKITATKDYGMIELWDDRAVQVKPNTGERADGN